ncbi:MAG: hypothetical protein WCO77_07135 [bacterium]
MSALFILKPFAAQARGKRLKEMLSAEICAAPPGVSGLVLGTGRDYQEAQGDEQAMWLSWCAQPGCVLLLIPPFRTGAAFGPKNWGVVDLDGVPIFPTPANPLLGCVAGEIRFRLSGSLSRPLNPGIEVDVSPMINGCFRRHPDSGLFAVSGVPLWSLNLLDQGDLVKAWLMAWLELAGKPVAIASSGERNAELPLGQQHFAILLHLCPGIHGGREAALNALTWSPNIELDRQTAESAYGELEAAGLAEEGKLTAMGLAQLERSPYWPYADALMRRKDVS